MIFDGHNMQVLEKFGGPPETRTPDPLIKSPLPTRIQSTLAYSSEEKLSIPLVAFGGFQMERTDYTRTQHGGRVLNPAPVLIT